LRSLRPGPMRWLRACGPVGELANLHPADAVLNLPARYLWCCRYHDRYLWCCRYHDRYR
jgi:hypothetical protein